MKPINQTLLSIGIALIMLAGFVGIYAVGYEYEQTTVPEDIFVSDSNTEFDAIDLSAYADSIGFINYPILQPVEYWIHDINYGLPDYLVVHSTNLTMVYTGNNTWDTAIPGDSTAPYRSHSHIVYIPVKLDILKSVLVTSINLKMNLPGDLDIDVESYIASSNNPVKLTDIGQYTRIQAQTSYNSETTYNETFDISPFQALQMYSNANQMPETYWAIEIYDANDNGLSPYNLNMSISMTGKFVTTWSLQDSVNLVLGLSIGGNIVLIVYMTDAVDFDGYRKDLSNRSSGSKRKGKKGNWRK